MSQWTTLVLIAAPADAAWRVLADAAGYAAWNPGIVEVQGRFGAGERITVRVKVGTRGGGTAIRSVPMRVTEWEPPSRMAWTGGLLGLFTGRRAFTLAPRDGGTDLRIELSMTGPLSGPISRSVGHRQPDIDAFATALKARVERG